LPLWLTRIAADAAFHHFSGLMRGRICLSSPPTGLDAYSQNALELPQWVTPLLSLGIRAPLRPACADQPRIASSERHLAVQTISGGSGISTGCPSPTTFVLGLGPTNPERTSLPQETLGLRRVGFSPTSRYSCRHSHSRPLQPSSRSTFTAEQDAPLPSRNDPKVVQDPRLRYQA
jgi:hypothetical protein